MTFHHFSSPQWLLQKGGWESDATPALFARYCWRMASDLGDLISGGCTINEANIGRVLISSGLLPPMSQIRNAPGWLEAAAQLGISAATLNPFMFAIYAVLILFIIILPLFVSGGFKAFQIHKESNSFFAGVPDCRTSYPSRRAFKARGI